MSELVQQYRDEVDVSSVLCIQSEIPSRSCQAVRATDLAVEPRTDIITRWVYVHFRQLVRQRFRIPRIRLRRIREIRKNLNGSCRAQHRRTGIARQRFKARLYLD